MSVGYDLREVCPIECHRRQFKHMKSCNVEDFKISSLTPVQHGLVDESRVFLWVTALAGLELANRSLSV